MFTPEMIAELAALIAKGAAGRTGADNDRLTVLEAAKAASTTVDVFAPLRAELATVAGFVGAQLNKRGGAQPLPFGAYQSNLDGITGLPAMLGLDPKTGKGEEREYEKKKYNVALYFALTGGPVGATNGGRISQQMIADYPQFLVETPGQPLSVAGSFGITVSTKEGRRTATLHVSQESYDEAIHATK